MAWCWTICKPFQRQDKMTRGKLRIHSNCGDSRFNSPRLQIRRSCSSFRDSVCYYLLDWVSVYNIVMQYREGFLGRSKVASLASLLDERVVKPRRTFEQVHSHNLSAFEGFGFRFRQGLSVITKLGRLTKYIAPSFATQDFQGIDALLARCYQKFNIQGGSTRDRVWSLTLLGASGEYSDVFFYSFRGWRRQSCWYCSIVACR